MFFVWSLMNEVVRMVNNELNLVQMDAVSKHFPGVQALDHVTFACHKGEIHALIGENGAGKSTLIKILGGVFPPDSGNISVRGEHVSFKSPHEAQQAGIRIVHQEFSLIPYMSVTENILLGQEKCRLGFVNASKLRQQAMQSLEMVHAYLDPDTWVSHLNAGQQKLVEIAKALATAPNILIVDEPTAPLTKQETQDFFQVLKTLQKAGTTIIYISHRLEEIFQIADRVTVLKDGKKVTTKEIGATNEDEVIRLMIGRELGDMFPEKTAAITQEPILSVRRLSYRDELSDIQFDLHKGEILGIAGLEGQGQDILLKTIFGIFPKDQGEIRIDGNSIDIRSPAQAIEAGMALVTDKRGSEGLCLELSVRDNLALPTLHTRQHFGVINSAQENAIIHASVAHLQIRTPSLKQLVKLLSGGNQQKIVVGKWLIANPRIMLFIDPTAGIDVGAKTELYRLMRELADQKGLGVLVVTSDMLELLGLCDRILVMYQGRLVREIPGNEATEEEIMRAAVGKTQPSNRHGNQGTEGGQIS